jgi:Na+/melibiose symporter-like transporter
MGPAYAMVATLYAVSIALTLKAGGARPAHAAPAKTAAPVSPWRDLKEGAQYIWKTPHLRAVMGFAFILNLTAFPLYNGLQPYVAKEIYGTDQTGLGYMVAGAAFGALAGSILLSRFGHLVRPARTMIVFCAVWYAALFAYSHTTHPAVGVPILVMAGIAQSMGMVTMGTLLLRTSDPQYRGRMMGIRMLAVYGNMPGLLIAGPLIASIGYPLTATLYCVLGLLFTLFVALRWGHYLWRKDAPANIR